MEINIMSYGDKLPTSVISLQNKTKPMNIASFGAI